MTPVRLQVEVGIDGFRAVLPRKLLGSNSGWILPFVCLWWGGCGGIAWLFAGTGLHDQLPVEFQVAYGVFGLGGWALGWFVFDRWQAGRPAGVIDADTLGITLGEQQLPWSSIAAVTYTPYTVVVELVGEANIDFRRYGLAGHERRWLFEQLSVLHEHFEHEGTAPEQLRALGERV